MSGKVQPNITSYVDTQLIECSRLQSIEYSADSTGKSKAIFTNRQSYGIQLDEGDTVSLNSAYISEVGAGGEVIEFTGQENGDTYTVEHTNASLGDEIATLGLLEGKDQYALEDYKMPHTPSNKHTHYSVNTSNITSTFPIKDNEINFTTSFYKTTNGEGYFHLPRRFLHAATFSMISDFYANSVSASDAISRVNQTYQTRTWLPMTNNNEINYEESGQILRGDDNFEWQVRCQADNHLQRYIPRGNDTTTGRPYYVKQNDNSRYKIFRREETTWYPFGSIPASYKPLLEGKEDIALQDYVEVKQLQNVTIEEGFDTPSNIATNITEQLSKKQSSRDLKVRVNNASGLGSSEEFQNELVIGELYESALFKPFEAATEATFNKTASRRFFAGVNEAGDSSTSETFLYNQSTLDFYNSFHHIGLKRPEVFITQRKLKRFGDIEIEIVEDIPGSASVTPNTVIPTNLRWESVNPHTGNYYLTDFKEAFDAQALYPELFEYSWRSGVDPVQFINASVNRFIHIASASNANHLGCDNMLFTGDTPITDNLSGSESLPIFINYVESQASNTDVEADGKNASNLWGGFAIKYRAFNEDFIGFTCDHLFRYEQGLFNASGNIERDRPVGFDRHFSAYGTSAIGLYNGKTIQCYTDPGEADIIAGASTNTSNILARAQMELFTDKGQRVYFSGFDQYPFLYLGAPEPLFNFDTTLNRFTISGLYSPEFIGNFIQAGDSFPNNPYTISTNPKTKVYFINKRLRANSFCADMVPYNRTLTVPAIFQYDYTDRTYLPFNINLKQYHIYDSHSGVLWNDFGTNRKNWDNNSLFGLLGFDYDSLHPSNPTNFQTRYSFSTQNPTTVGLTTNTQENATDIISQAQNAVEAPFFNYTMPGGTHANAALLEIESLGGTELFMTDLNDGSENLAIIVVEDAQSIDIRAKNLPKKTTRPYYLIRSNIIQQNNFMNSSGSILPVIGIVNKINGYQDFYSTENQGVEFTVTKSFVLTSIRTSIHQPDGRLAEVDNNSSVIYKITKNKNLTLNLSDIVLQE